MKKMRIFYTKYGRKLSNTFQSRRVMKEKRRHHHGTRKVSDLYASLRIRPPVRFASCYVLSLEAISL